MFTALLAVLAPASPSAAQATTQAATRPSENAAVVERLMRVFRSSVGQETQVDLAITLLDQYPSSHAELARVLGRADEPAASKHAILQALRERREPPGEVFVEPLFTLLLGSDSDLASRAGGTLIRVRDKRVAERLLTLGNDSTATPPARQAAIAALSELSFFDSLPDTVDGLTKALDDEVTAEIAVAVLNELLKLNSNSPTAWKEWWAQRKGVPPIRWLPDVNDRLVRDFNDVLIRRSSDLRSAYDALELRLKITLEQLYAKTPESSREPLLISWLQDMIPAVQLVALEELERLILYGKPEQITPRVREQLRILLAASDPRVRADVVRLLGTLRDESASATLTTLLKTETDPAVKVELLLAVSNMGVSSLADMIVRGLQDPSAVVSAGSARAMVNWVQLDRSWAAHVDALGEALDQRYRKLTPDEADLNEALVLAMSAISAPGREHFRDAFEVAARHPLASIRRAGLTGLAKLEADDTASLFATALGDRDASVRAAAVDGLGKVAQSNEHIRLLTMHGRPETEPDADVRLRAWQAALRLLAARPADQLLPLVQAYFRGPYEPASTIAQQLVDVTEAVLKASPGVLDGPRAELARLALDAYIASAQYTLADNRLMQLPGSWDSFRIERKLILLIRSNATPAAVLDFLRTHTPGPSGIDPYLPLLLDELLRLRSQTDGTSAYLLARAVVDRFAMPTAWREQFESLAQPSTTQPAVP